MAGGRAGRHNGGVTDSDSSKGVDEAVREYIGRLEARRRPLFDRVHELILAALVHAALGPG
jgi:hypothetical protein